MYRMGRECYDAPGTLQVGVKYDYESDEKEMAGMISEEKRVLRKKTIESLAVDLEKIDERDLVRGSWERVPHELLQRARTSMERHHEAAGARPQPRPSCL